MKRARVQRAQPEKMLGMAFLLLLICLVAGCGSALPATGGQVSAAEGTVPGASGPAATAGGRDPAAVVLVPEALGERMLGNAGVTIDVSNAPRGYVCVSYLGDNPKVKLQITREEERTYTYDLHQNATEVFP